MVVIQNTEAINIIRDQAGLSLKEGFPQNLAMTVQPVLDMTPDFHKNFICSANTTTSTGSATVLSAKEKVQYVIHGYSASFIKDATCDAADGTVQWNITQGGVVRAIVVFPILTLTAQSQAVSCWFNRPIRCDVNTIVQAASITFTAGKLRRSIVLYVSEETVQ